MGTFARTAIASTLPGVVSVASTSARVRLPVPMPIPLPGALAAVEDLLEEDARPVRVAVRLLFAERGPARGAVAPRLFDGRAAGRAVGHEVALALLVEKAFLGLWAVSLGAASRRHGPR